jgi:cephalosporin-C deacetylase-like acetyl esterase
MFKRLTRRGKMILKDSRRRNYLLRRVILLMVAFALIQAPFNIIGSAQSTQDISVSPVQTTEDLTYGNPYDIWTPEVMTRIRDQRTLGLKIIPRVGYFEIFYNSEVGTANWADSGPPYGLHTGDTIRIHGYLATPVFGGPYPAIVIGHGHGGSGSPELAIALAALGYVAFSIDGPRSGQSTGGPQDTEQAWVSVEPSANYSFLYHYAYAGMRALTVFESLSNIIFNPFRIDRNRLGVLGASMGGQFTYYINGVDTRVKGAVAIAVAGDWHNLLYYQGAWLYHGLYHHTRDGLPSGTDALNAVSNTCTDSTLQSFLTHFDPISYAPKQNGPLLTIVGSHDQYFTVPAINNTFDRVASAGTNSRFIKRVLISPNGEHIVVNQNAFITSVKSVLTTVNNWFKYCFKNGRIPPQTPTVSMTVSNNVMTFTANVVPGSSSISRVRLYGASQIDTLPSQPNDFGYLTLSSVGGNTYRASLRVGAIPPNGPVLTPDNMLYFIEVTDSAGYTVTSKMQYRSGQMTFCSGFIPRIEHFPADSLPVPPAPLTNCACNK